MTTTPKPPANNPPGFRTPSEVLREQADIKEVKRQELVKRYPARNPGINEAFRGPTKKG